MTHGYTFDEWHAGLLTPILLLCVAWFLAAMRAERTGRGLLIIAAGAAAAATGAVLVSPIIGLYLVQWPTAAALGRGYARNLRRPGP